MAAVSSVSGVVTEDDDAIAIRPWSTAAVCGGDEHNDGSTTARFAVRMEACDTTADSDSGAGSGSGGGSGGVRLVDGGSGGLLSLRPRPRTISSAQTSLLMRLSRLHLDWHISAYPNCTFALRRVGGVSVRAEKTLLLLDLHATFKGSEGGCSTGRIIMLEKEAAVKVILFDSLVSVSTLTTDTLRLVYWFDPGQRALGVGAAGRTPSAKQYMLVLTFASHLDARDVHALLSHVIKHPLPAEPRSPFRAPGASGGPAEFVCIHSGWLEKKGKYSWSHRFARLYAGGRLTIFRNDKAIFPVNVLSLSAGAEGVESKLVPKQVGKDQISFELAVTGAHPAVPSPRQQQQQGNGSNTANQISPSVTAASTGGSGAPSPSSAASAAAAASASATASAATSTSAPASPTPYSTLLRFETQRERDRWYSALKIDYDQPFKTALARLHSTQATAQSSAAVTPITAATSASSAAAAATASGPGSAPAVADMPEPALSNELHMKLTVDFVASPPASSVVPPSASSSTSASASASGSTTPTSLHYSPTSAVVLRQNASSGRIAVTGPPPSGLARAAPARPLSPAEAAAAAERTAVAAHSYYLQLLTLLATPEALRLPSDAEEIIIPLNPSCGTVNVTQLSKHSNATVAAAMPHASNPRAAAGTGAGSKAQSPRGGTPGTPGTPATATTSPAAVSPSTPSPSPPPPSGASFNPATHQRISVAALLQRVSNQQPFFHFLSYVRSHHSALLLRTSLPTLSQFQSSTPSTSIFSLGKRGSSLQAIDSALARYHALHSIGGSYLGQSKLLLAESSLAGNSTSSQIAFSWEGFDSQIFTVGMYAVVSPAQMWRGGDTAFDEGEWNQALKAQCVGKELMQSSADLTALMESEQASDQHRARTLMHQSQLEVLHNIALAAHVRSRWNAERQRIREGEVVYWSAVLTQFEGGGGEQESRSASSSPMPSPRSPAGGAPTLASSASSSGAGAVADYSCPSDAEMFQYSRNLMQLEQFYELQYVFAPSKALMTHFLRVRLEQWERESGPGAAAGAGAGYYGASGDSTPALGPESPRGSPRCSPRRDRDAEVEFVPNPYLASSVPSSATASSPAAAAAAAAASASANSGAYSPHRQFLFDAFHYLLFLRLLLDHRKTLLERCENAVHEWLGRYQKDAGKSTATPKYDAVVAFKLLVEGEKRALVQALADLPNSDVVEAVIKLQSRTHTQHALQQFLPQRPAPHDPQLQRCGAGAGAMLTAEQLEQRARARLQRKSVLLQHMASRLQVASPTHAALTVVTSPPPIQSHTLHTVDDDLTPPTSSRLRATAAISKEAPY